MLGSLEDVCASPIIQITDLKSTGAPPNQSDRSDNSLDAERYTRKSNEEILSLNQNQKTTVFNTNVWYRLICACQLGISCNVSYKREGACVLFCQLWLKNGNGPSQQTKLAGVASSFSFAPSFHAWLQPFLVIQKQCGQGSVEDFLNFYVSLCNVSGQMMLTCWLHGA